MKGVLSDILLGILHALMLGMVPCRVGTVHHPAANITTYDLQIHLLLALVHYLGGVGLSADPHPPVQPIGVRILRGSRHRHRIRRGVYQCNAHT